MRTPRPPRQPRPPREAEEGNESRRGRNNGERQPRNRVENKDSDVVDSKIEEALPLAAIPLTASASATSIIVAAPILLPDNMNVSEPVTEDAALENAETSEQGDEPRRRRRRGGRNRNRRDREPGDELESGDIAAVTDVTAAPVDSSWASMVQSTPVVSEAISTAVPTTIQGEITQATVAPVALATIPVEIVATEMVPSESVTPGAVIIAPAEAMAPAEVSTPVEAIAPVEVSTPVEVVELAEPVAVSEAVTSEEKTSTPSVSISTAAEPDTATDLQKMLASAGLMQTTTDPEKLRAAKESAEKIAPPVEVHRDRKPLPSLPTEPLSQVETRS